MNLKFVIKICWVLAIAVSALIRPPGVMLAQEGETITYVLCTGGGFETVTVPLHEDGSGTADEWCDFYSVLVPALPFGAPDVAPIQLEVARLSVIVPVQLHAALVGLPPFSSRAPPLFG